MSQKSDIQKLYEAAEFAHFDAAAGWPSEVTPAQLIALWVGHEYLPPLGEPQTVTIQDQDGRIVHQSKQPDPRTRERGTETEAKRKACKVAAAMLRDAGIETEERTEITPRPPLRVLRLNPVGTIEKEQPPEVRKWVVVTRDAVQQCLNRLGMSAPEYIRAWLALEVAQQGDAAAPEPLTPLKRAAIIDRLGRKYPTLESALNRGEEWAKVCRVPNRNGWYYLERIEAECRARYGGAAPAPAADMSPAAQIRRISG